MSLIWSSKFQIWEPAELGSSLALWLDADDAGTVILNGSNVAQWRDKSGNNRHASQSVASLQPQRTLNGLNGKPVIRFLAGGPALTLPTTLTAFNNTYVALLLREGIGNIAVFLENTSSYAYLHYENNWWTGPASSNVPMNSNTWYTNISDNGTKFSNGLSVAGSSTSAGGSGLTQIGSPLSTNNFMVAEILFLAGSVSTTNRQRLEGYLAWKWGLVANLPANHPFRFTPPLPGV